MTFSGLGPVGGTLMPHATHNTAAGSEDSASKSTLKRSIASLATDEMVKLARRISDCGMVLPVRSVVIEKPSVGYGRPVGPERTTEIRWTGRDDTDRPEIVDTAPAARNWNFGNEPTKSGLSKHARPRLRFILRRPLRWHVESADPLPAIRIALRHARLV